jgi:hypothetical protein
VQVPLQLAIAFHPDDAPNAWTCNGTVLTNASTYALLARAGLPFPPSSPHPSPYFGLDCLESDFEYMIGPSLSVASTTDPRVFLHARVWEFDTPSNGAMAATISLTTGAAAASPFEFQNASGVVSLSSAGFDQQGKQDVLLRVRASELPPAFLPGGRAHLELTAIQLVESTQAFPSVLARHLASLAPLGWNETRCCNGTGVAWLERVPLMAVRRPWPMLQLALDQADWEIPPPLPSQTGAIVGGVVGGVLALLVGWWLWQNRWLFASSPSVGVSTVTELELVPTPGAGLNDD